MQYNRYFKRLFDMLFSIFGLLIISPVFVFTYFMLMFINKGKPFFFQRRPGKDGELFCVIKFKTMTDKKDDSGNLLPDEKRITKIGMLIRKLSIDELPQLINVLIGDMSIVGPRPLLEEYLNFYNDFQKKRLEVRPGITGWAQVNGRNAISWEEKFRYDVWYVKNISFFLDLKILFLTVKKVFKLEGISSENSVTMEKFKGNK